MGDHQDRADHPREGARHRRRRVPEGRDRGKENCPVSQALAVEISLDAALET
jgi:hypothetical protein